MQIWLSEDGPPLWFLGEPRKLIASLNMQNPGPIELDFDNLGLLDQMRVLTAMKNGAITGDPAFEVLYADWSKKNKSAPKSQDTTTSNQTKAVVDSHLHAEVARIEKENKFQERCTWALGQNIKSLKSIIQNCDDLRFLREVLKAEQVGKGRKTVIKWIRERLTRFERAIANEAIKTVPDARDPFRPKETIPYAVVESEQETIILSPEELIGVLAK